MSDPISSIPPAAAAPAPTRRRGFRPIHWLLLSMAALAVVVVVEVLSIFFLASEARQLQVAVEKSTHWRTQTQVQFSIGPGLLSLARTVVAFVPDVPPEARQALRAVHRASVGVYHLAESPTVAERMAMLAATQARLEGEGWSRVVGVNQGNDTVSVFTPANWNGEGKVDVCVVVCSGTDLVLVSATARIEPLLDLVAEHSGHWGREWRAEAQAELARSL